MSPLDYPLPKHAAYIWTNGDRIIVTFPGYEGHDSRRFNSVTLRPDDPAALKTLWAILQSRANASEGERKIGGAATPTRGMVEEMMKRYRAKPKPQKSEPSPEAMAKAEKILKELGLL